jgi:putative copper resistance protein D
VELTGWEAAVILAKAITYAATLGAAGAILFLGYNASLLRPAQRRHIRVFAAVLLIVAALGSAAKVLALSGSMSDDFAGMFDRSFAAMILRAGEGRAAGIRLAGLVVCGALLFSKLRTNLAAGAGALLAAASFAAVGHVHALKPNGTATLVLILHLWCGAFWLGGLWPLLYIARDGDALETAAVASRFGRIGVLLVPALIAAGALLLYRLLGSLSALWSSAYGRMLSLKLLLVAALLGAAALNKLWLTPRLRTGDAQARVHLRRSIGAEMLLGAMILLVTAALTTLAGPDD